MGNSSCAMSVGWTVQWGGENGCEVRGRKRDALIAIASTTLPS